MNIETTNRSERHAARQISYQLGKLEDLIQDAQRVHKMLYDLWLSDWASIDDAGLADMAAEIRRIGDVAGAAGTVESLRDLVS